MPGCSSAHHPIYSGLCSTVRFHLRRLQHMQVVKRIIAIENSTALTFSEEVKQISTVMVSNRVFQSVVFTTLGVNCTSSVVKRCFSVVFSPPCMLHLPRHHVVSRKHYSLFILSVGWSMGISV